MSKISGRGIAFLLLGVAGVLVSGWGVVWLAAAACRGVLSLMHLAAAVLGLCAAAGGLAGWEMDDAVA